MHAEVWVLPKKKRENGAERAEWAARKTALLDVGCLVADPHLHLVL